MSLVRSLVFTVMLILGIPVVGMAQVEEPPPTAVLDSVVVEGNQWVSDDLVVGTAALMTGVPVTLPQIQAAERRLWGTGRFDDIRILIREGVGLPTILVIQVDERPVVRRYRIEGLRNVGEREVRDSVGFRDGEYLSPQRIVAAESYIRARLAARGIPFANIQSERLPYAADGSEVDVLITVEEGTRVTVAQVAFQGNDAFRDSELHRVLATRPEGFFWFRGGEYLQDALELDLAHRLPEFYASHGFLDLRIVEDTLIIDQQTGKARLEVTLDEGPQYRLAEFDVEGNTQFSTAELEAYYGTEEGGLLRSLGISRSRDTGLPIFDRGALMDATRQVEQLYRNSGYLRVSVEPVLDRRPPAGDEDVPTVAARWVIEEGPPAYIRRVHIKGNDFTHDRIIREQIALLPGDIYSDERILRSYQAISGLGFFENPLPLPDIDLDPETGDVDVTFEVVEQATGSINFGTSMGGLFGVSGFIGYEQPNLFGQAKSGSLRWDFGRYQNNFQLQYTDPSLRETRVSGSFALFDSRDRLFNFASGERKRRGVMTRFGLPVPGSRYARYFVGYSLSRTTYRLRGGSDDGSLFDREPGTQSQILLGVNRRTVNHPIFPTMGSTLGVEFELNGGPLGGDGDFVKQQVRGEWWVPVAQVGGGAGSRPIDFALGLNAKAGTIFGDAGSFPFDQFWLGGVQFGESLRGYSETTITPLGYFPQGSPQVTEIERLGNTFLRVGSELAVRLNDNISVSAFYEAGNVWRSPREMDPARLFRGAGFGAMLVTPFGPIGVDYAYGFDRPVPAWQLHFNMGGGGPF
jgi:outer membrane protein insertion porin family